MFGPSALYSRGLSFSPKVPLGLAGVRPFSPSCTLGTFSPPLYPGIGRTQSFRLPGTLGTGGTQSSSSPGILGTGSSKMTGTGEPLTESVPRTGTGTVTTFACHLSTWCAPYTAVHHVCIGTKPHHRHTCTTVKISVLGVSRTKKNVKYGGIYVPGARYLYLVRRTAVPGSWFPREKVATSKIVTKARVFYNEESPVFFEQRLTFFRLIWFLPCFPRAGCSTPDLPHLLFPLCRSVANAYVIYCCCTINTYFKYICCRFFVLLTIDRSRVFRDGPPSLPQPVPRLLGCNQSLAARRRQRTTKKGRTQVRSALHSYQVPVPGTRYQAPVPYSEPLGGGQGWFMHAASDLFAWSTEPLMTNAGSTKRHQYRTDL